MIYHSNLKVETNLKQEDMWCFSELNCFQYLSDWSSKHLSQHPLSGYAAWAKWSNRGWKPYETSGSSSCWRNDSSKKQVNSSTNVSAAQKVRLFSRHRLKDVPANSKTNNATREVPCPGSKIFKLGTCVSGGFRTLASSEFRYCTGSQGETSNTSEVVQLYIKRVCPLRFSREGMGRDGKGW